MASRAGGERAGEEVQPHHRSSQQSEALQGLVDVVERQDQEGPGARQAGERAARAPRQQKPARKSPAGGQLRQEQDGALQGSPEPSPDRGRAAHPSVHRDDGPRCEEAICHRDGVASHARDLLQLPPDGHRHGLACLRRRPAVRHLRAAHPRDQAVSGERREGLPRLWAGPLAHVARPELERLRVVQGRVPPVVDGSGAPVCRHAGREDLRPGLCVLGHHGAAAGAAVLSLPLPEHREAGAEDPGHRG
mmetsp:Transcript_6058/g.23529  ORF Transcript_6058/g.23529 Transcript_6058/m.23529 type:complete len:248 (-) Transcript_6058:3687-4430(-)